MQGKEGERQNRLGNNSRKATIIHKVLINSAVVSERVAQSGALLTMPVPGIWGLGKCQAFFFLNDLFVYFCSLYLWIDLCNDLFILASKAA